MPHATFDAGTWAPARQEYGLLHLLLARSAILEELASLVPAKNCLKSLDTRLCSPALGPAKANPGGNSPGGVALPPLEEEEDDDSDASYISEGEPSEPSQLVSWGKGQRGAWWRVRASLREDLAIRAGVSLASAELRRAAPGELLQQKGHPRVLGSGRSQGCIRMPIQPCGWVTADASRCGGSQYLIRAHTPRWKAVYQSPTSSTGDVIVRASIELSSEAVVALYFGDIVEQAGPPQECQNGIVRMPIMSSRRGSADNEEHARAEDAGVTPKVSGWVTVDASAAGGPVFFKALGEGGGGAANKPRRTRNQSSVG